MLFYELISIDQCRNWTQANWNVSILIWYARDTRYYVTIFVNNNLYWHINLYWLVRVNLLVWSCVRKLDELFLVDSHNLLEKYHIGSLSSINSTKFRNIVSIKKFFEYGSWFNCCKVLRNTICYICLIFGTRTIFIHDINYIIEEQKATSQILRLPDLTQGTV